MPYKKSDSLIGKYPLRELLGNGQERGKKKVDRICKFDA